MHVRNGCTSDKVKFNTNFQGFDGREEGRERGLWNKGSAALKCDKVVSLRISSSLYTFCTI